jgi:hypothetical protein
MIVDETRRLHMRVNDGRADEAESAAFEVLAQCVGLRTRRWDIGLFFEAVADRLSADETPNVLVEATEFLLDLEKLAGVLNRGNDLLTVPDDSRIVDESLNRPAPSRFRNTVAQLKPACALSSKRNSKCLASSRTGTPHSSSW